MSLSRRTIHMSALALGSALALSAVVAAHAANPPASDAQRLAALDARITALEKTLQTLNAKPAVNAQAAGGGTCGAAAAKNAAAANAPKDPAADKAAAEIKQLAAAGRMTEAKVKFDAFVPKYGSTSAMTDLGTLAGELEVIGRAVPATFDIEKWYQGGPTMPAGKATMYVFFEEWCGSCSLAFPKCEAFQTSLKSKGLVVVGVTQGQARGDNPEEAMKTYIKNAKVNLPIAKDAGSVNDLFNVKGLPAAAIVKDGKVVWRGNPMTLTDSTLQSLL